MHHPFYANKEEESAMHIIPSTIYHKKEPKKKKS